MKFNLFLSLLVCFQVSAELKTLELDDMEAVTVTVDAYVGDLLLKKIEKLERSDSEKMYGLSDQIHNTINAMKNPTITDFGYNIVDAPLPGEIATPAELYQMEVCNCIP